MLPISIVVPCFPRDTNKLKTCLDSIENQSKKPTEVVIGHSEITVEKCNTLKENFNYSFNIIFAHTVKKCFAAENRNRACELTNCDYISFFDADDQMASQRLEIIWQIIDKYDPKCVVHGFLDNKNILEKKFPNPDPKNLKFGKELYNICKKTEGKYLFLKGLLLHHGHSTIKSSLMNTFKFNESLKFKRGQDSKFIRDILNNSPIEDKTMIFIDLPLSYYIPNEKQHK